MIFTLIVISGVAGLIAILTKVSVILNALGLSDQKQALGLPKGSVRALIALTLIITFSIMAFYFYGELGGTHSEEQSSFAQQTLTTVSTLVEAVAAFYFGAKSVEVAKEAVATPKLEITPSEEIEMDIKKKEKKIMVETTPRDEKISWKVSGDKPEALVQIKPDEFKYKASEDLKDGAIVILAFTLAKYTGARAETLSVTIKNK